MLCVSAALLFLTWAHRQLGGRWSDLATTVLAPTLPAHMLAGLLHAGTAAAALPVGRADALGVLLLPGVLWALLAPALLVTWLSTPEERRALARRLPRIRIWRNA